MKATGNKIIAELKRKNTKIKALNSLANTAPTDEIYDTLRVLSLGKAAEAEGISVGDYIHMKVIDNPKTAPYIIKMTETPKYNIAEMIVEIYDIFAFTKKSEYNKDVEPNQA